MWVLREELEKWKESSKNKATQNLETLAEAAKQFENPLSMPKKEELLCPGCGDLFKLSRYLECLVMSTVWIFVVRAG